MTPLVQRLQRLSAQGLTAKEAGKKAGVSAKSARMLGYRHGFTFAYEGTITVRRIREAAARNLTATQASRFLGLDRSHMTRLAKAHGITFRSHADYQASLRQSAAPTAEELARQEAERMARWRAAWAEKKAAKAGRLVPANVTDEASLGAAMRAVAAGERAAYRRRIMGSVAA